MSRTRLDRDRMLLYTVLLSAIVGIVLYAIVYVTVATYGPLNEQGLLVGRVALFVTGGTLGIALVLALTARSAALATTLSGSGWLVVFGGAALLFPAWGMSAAGVPGLSAFSGYAGALFLVIAGTLVVQAEHTARERQNPSGEDRP